MASGDADEQSTPGHDAAGSGRSGFLRSSSKRRRRTMTEDGHDGEGGAMQRYSGGLVGDFTQVCVPVSPPPVGSKKSTTTLIVSPNYACGSSHWLRGVHSS